MWRERLPTEIEVKAWFANLPDALCIICGKVSGNLEVIDFDNHGELFPAWQSKISPELLAKLVIEETQSGGFHVAYRCTEEVAGNMKLAQGFRNEKLSSLIETRGNGGLVIASPTAGYTLKQGSFICLPVLSSEERTQLLSVAFELNEHQSELKQSVSATCNDADTFVERPGDAFNQRGNVRNLLLQYGWTPVTVKDGSELFKRPGKTDEGWSASLKDGVFYVFSTNAAPFEAEKGYSPFQVYAILRHGGDFKATAHDLLLNGYGATDGYADIDLSQFNVKSETQITVAPEPETPKPWRKVTNEDIEQLLNGTLLGELCTIYASVSRPRLPLEAALLKAVVTAGCCLSGQASPDELNRRYGGNLGGVKLIGADRARLKINTAGGQVCNIYGMIVANSTSGKDIGGLIGKFARMHNPHIQCADGDNAIADWNLGNATSAEGFAKLLVKKPNGLLEIGEMTNWLDPKSWQGKATVFLTESFGQGYFEQNFSDRGGGASSRSADYCYPNIIANIQPENFENNVRMQYINTGFLGRFLFGKMPEFYGNPARFDSMAIMEQIRLIADVFLRKKGVVEMDEYYSDELQSLFIDNCESKLNPSWRRLCNEYYPRFMVMLPVTHNLKTQGESVIITDDVKKRAQLLTMWFFAQAEKLLTGVMDDLGNSREVEQKLKRLFEIVRDYGRTDGILTSTISTHASGSGTTAKQRQELLQELRERQWIKFENNRYSVLHPPPHLEAKKRK